MTYQMVATAVTLNDLEGHSPVAVTQKAARAQKLLLTTNRKSYARSIGAKLDDSMTLNVFRHFRDFCQFWQLTTPITMKILILIRWR